MSRRWRTVAVHAFAFLAVSLASMPAPADVLVSNFSQTATTNALFWQDRAQGFTTGSNSTGYTLSSVEAMLSTLNSGSYNSLTVTIQTDVNGNPGTLVGTLTRPAYQNSSSPITFTFTAPEGGLDLTANTTYYVVFDVSTAGSNQLAGTANSNEDSGAAPGWSIANNSRERQSNNFGGWRTTNTPIHKIRISGAAKPPGPPPEVMVSPGTPLAVTERHATRDTDHYTMRLRTDPGANVVITATSDDPAVEVDTSKASGVQNTLTFTGGSSGNWSRWQTVFVRAANDGDVDSEQNVMITHSASVNPTSNPYHEISIASVEVDVTDAGHGVLVSKSTLFVHLGDPTATYTLSLKSAPGGTLTIAPSSGDTTKATVSGPVSFNDGNWSIPQDVTVTGVAASAAPVAITHTVTAPTSNYAAGVAIGAVSAYVKEAPVVVSLARTGAASIVEGTPSWLGRPAVAGGKIAFTVTLARALAAGERVDVLLALSGKGVTASDFGPLTKKTGAGLNTGVGIEAASTLAPAVVFAGAGARVATLEMEATDQYLEDDETVTVALAADARQIADTDSTHPALRHQTNHSFDVTVTDNEYTFSFDKADTHEVSEGDGTVSLPLTLSRALDSDILVRFNYFETFGNGLADPPTVGTPGAAVSGEDYEEAHAYPDFATIKAGATSFTLKLEILDDDLIEGVERLRIEAVPPRQPLGSFLDRLDVYIADNDPTVSVAAGASPVTEGTDATFAVRRNAVSASALTVNLNVAESGDFVAAGDEGATTVTILANQAEATLTVRTQTDMTAESDGAVTVTVSDPTTPGAYFADDEAATVKVLDDDTPGVRISETGVEVAESDDGTTDAQEHKATYTVRLAAPPDGSVTVTPTSGDTTAATVTPASLVFAPGDWSDPQTVTVTAVDDGLDNAGGKRSATITHAVSAAGTNYAGVTAGSVSVDVLDDDEPGVTVSAGALALAEGGDPGTYTLMLGSDPGAAVNVTVTSGDPSAVTVQGPSGAAGASAMIAFTPGAGGTWKTPQTVTVRAVEDADGVGERNVALTHAAAVPSDNTHAYHGITIGSVLVTVEDNDIRTVVASTDAIALAEADDPGTTNVKENEASYTLRLSHAPSGDVTVTHSSSGVVLDMSPATLTFKPSDWNEPQTVTVRAVDNDIDNKDEQSTGTIVHAVSASGADYADAPTVAVSATVADDDGAPVLSIASAAVAEGNTGSTNLGFTVTLAPASGKTVTVTWADAGTGTATAGADYATLTGGTLTFAAGETTKQLNVSVTGDTADESDETVVLRLSAPSNATLEGGGTTLDATGAILDDEGVGVVVSLARSGSAVTLTEGTAEGSLALPGDKLTFTVTLARALFAGERLDAPLVLSGTNITAGDFADLAASAGKGLNTGVRIEDAGTLTPTVVFAGRGARVATLELEPIDTDLESDEETVTVALGSDPQFAADTHTNVPGGAGRDATANSFDATVADDEFVFAFTKTGRHDVSEGDGTVSLALTLSRELSRDIDVRFVYRDRDQVVNPNDPKNVPGPWKDAATKDEDYEAAYAHPEFATIKAGATSFTLEFDLIDDAVVEPTERLRIEARPPWYPRGALPSEIDVYIADNDPTVTVAADASAVTEGAGAAFTVRRNAVSASPMTINLTVAESGGGDFVAASDEGAKTVTILANQAQATYTVPTQTDQTPEASTEVTVTVLAPTTPGTYFVGKDSAASVTVRDHALDVALAPATASVTEADSTDVYLDFTVTKPNVDSGESLHYTLCLAGTAVRDENATKAAGEDYRLVAPAGSGTLQWDGDCVAHSLGRNDTSQTWRLQVFGDTTPEPDETVTVTLAASSGNPLPEGWSVGSDNAGAYTIVNDDALGVTLAAGGASINESGSGNRTDVTVTLGRTLVSGETVTVPLTVSGATVTTHYTLAKKAGGNTGVTLATSGAHSAQNPAVVFSGAGAGTATLELTAVDNADAAARTVTVAYGTGSRVPSKTGFGGGLSLAGSPRAVAIANDDTKGIVLSPIALTVDEGAEATYTVALATEPVGGAVTVTVTGTSGTDLTVDTDPDTGGDQDTLTFTASDWDDAQTVTVTAAHDNGPGNDNVTLAHAASGADYGSVTANLPVTIDDDEEPTPTFSLALAPGAPDTAPEDGEPIELRIVIEDGRFNYDDTLFDEVFLKATGTAVRRGDYRLEYRFRDRWLEQHGDAMPVAVYSADEPQYQRFRLVPRDDGRTEGEETVRLELVLPPANRAEFYSPYFLGDETAVELTLTDPPPPDTPAAAFAASASSADEDGGAVSVTVEFDPAPAEALTLNYTVSGTADAGEDYEALSGTLAVSAGSASTDIEVSVTDDDVSDPGETVVLKLAAGDGYALGPRTTHTLTIADDEEAPPAEPEARIDPGASITEGGDAVFTVTVTPAPSPAIFVNVNVVDSGDFASSGTGARRVRVGPNGTAGFAVPTVDDGTEEPDGTLTATIQTGEGYTLSATNASTIVVVRDNDPPMVSIAAGSDIEEGEDAIFTLTASPAPKSAITVNVNVVDSGDFAEDGEDGARTVSIGTSGTATLTVRTGGPDGVDEDDGTLTATVSGGAGYEPSASASAVVAVEDKDDPPPLPSVSVAPVKPVDEGGDVVFTLTASPAPAAEITVNVEVEESGDFAADGETGEKMVSIGTSGAATLTVRTDNDSGDEPHGYITATVKDGTGYAPSATDASATVVVRDDDDPPVIRIEPGADVTEGADATFTLTAIPAPGAPVTVHVNVTESGDFVESGQPYQRTVGIDASGTATLAVGTDDDDVDEDNGTITAEVRPSAGGRYTPSGARGSASVAVADNDDAPAASFAVADSEVDEDAGTVHVRVELSHPSASALELAYTVGGGAAAGDDYTIADSGSVTLAALAKSATVPVAIVDDADDEPAETVILTLTGGTGYTLGSRSTHTLTIAASDKTPVVTITGGDPVDEGGDAAFTVSADPAPADDLKVNLGIADAPAGSDFVAAEDEGSDTVTIPAGETSATYEVATVDDKADEPEGPVTATLKAGEGYVLGTPARAQVTVRDDDDPKSEISVTAGSAIDEGGDAAFTVTATPAPTKPLEVTLYIVEQGRYAEPGETGEQPVTVPASGSKTYTVQTVNDSDDEPNGSITVTVRPQPHYTVAAADSATVTVRDDDESNYAGVEVRIEDASAKEGEDLKFAIVLNRAAPGPITLSTTCIPGTARLNDDVECGSPVLRFEQGETRIVHRVWAVMDDIDEGNETFEFEIRNPDPAIVAITRGIATGTVENDGPLPSAWLARFGRTVAEQAIDGISARIESARSGARTPGFRGAFAGAPLGGATELDAAACKPASGDEATSGAENAAENAPGDPAEPAACAADTAAAAVAGATADPHGRGAWSGGPEGGPWGPAHAPAPFGTQPPSMGGVAGGPHGAGLGAGPGQGVGAGGIGQNPGGPAAGMGAPGLGGPGQGPSRAHGAQSATLLSLLMGSSFTYTREEDGAGGTLGFWGRGAHTSFNGRDGSLDLDGEVGTALLGADYARGNWLAGVALTQSFADGGYANPETGSGAVESTLTAAIPYAAWDVSERFSLWGAAGHGAGRMALTPGGERKGLAGPVRGMAPPPTGGSPDAPLASLRADIGWSMATAGLRASLFTGDGGGPSLAAVSDALWSRTTSEETEGMMAGAGEVTRLRLGLEGGWTFGLPGGGSLTPKIEAGVRRDGADAETGFGVEFGGGLNWTDPKRGLVLDIEGRTLVAHEADGMREVGFSASLGYDPSPDSPLGLSFNLRHAFGGQSSGGLDALFASDPLVPMGQDGAGQWTAEAAWGLPAFNDRFTGAPTLGYGVSGSGRDISVGWFLEPSDENAPDLRLGLKLTRRESPTEPPQHGIAVEIAARW